MFWGTNVWHWIILKVQETDPEGGMTIKYLSGLLIGILFGYVLKRSRLCFTGLIRDFYLMQKRFNLVLFLTMISVQGLIYYALGAVGAVRIPSYLPPFSLLSIALGSFLFGFGAVMANGCMTMTLVKCGDGRISGWLYLGVFMISAYIVAAGPLIGVSKYMRTIALCDDNLSIRPTLFPLGLFALLTITLLILLVRKNRRDNMKVEIPSKFKGFRHLVFEKVWSEESGPVAAGIVLGLVYPVSGLFGRHFGMAITSPIMSFVYVFLRPVETCGGCNPYDEVFGWGSMCVIGIIAGSFITASVGGEFKLLIPKKSELLRGIIGSILMGVGSMWGLGCLLGNGIVGTAQLSMKSWYALIFLIAGIWTAVRLTIMPAFRD